MINQSCGLNFLQYCKYFNSGIQKLWVAYTKNATFVYDNNIITDIFPLSWYEIKFSNAKISSNIANKTEETVLDLEVPYIDSNNKKVLKKLKQLEYSFLILTKNNEVFLLDSARNTQFIQQYTGNGFIIKEISIKNKSIYQVSFNYLLYLDGKLPIPPFDDCPIYSDDLALSSTQGPALDVQCIVGGYQGWIEP
jgi:hypothetical protein